MFSRSTNADQWAHWEVMPLEFSKAIAKCMEYLETPKEDIGFERSERMRVAGEVLAWKVQQAPLSQRIETLSLAHYLATKSDIYSEGESPIAIALTNVRKIVDSPTPGLTALLIERPQPPAFQIQGR